MNTWANLYLGSEPVNVAIADDQLLIGLADGNSIELPLSIVGEISGLEPVPVESRLVVLRHPPQIDHVHVTDSTLQVFFKDGRMLASPLAWFPRLLHGTLAERNTYVLTGDDDSIHWPDLDEDIELTRLIEGGPSAEGPVSLRRWLEKREHRTQNKSARQRTRKQAALAAD